MQIATYIDSVKIGHSQCKQPPKAESVKDRNRRAIMAAAGELASTRGMGSFTVAELAEAAGTSRRSIFNHFPSADSAVYAYLASQIEVLIEGIQDNLSEVESADDFVGQLSVAVNSDLSYALLGHVTSVLSSDPRRADTLTWASQIIDDSSQILIRVFEHYVPSLEETDRVLLSHSIISAIQTAQALWAHRYPTDPGNRADWEALNTRALNIVRYGITATN